MKPTPILFSINLLVLTVACHPKIDSQHRNPATIVESNITLHTYQGWTTDQMAQAYSTDEGSEIMPLRWLLSLELPHSQNKLKSQLGSFGLINDGLENNPRNPYRLPLGMTVRADKRTEHLYGEWQWVGVNCTACHTGIVELNGKKLIIDGGASLFDIQKFENAIVASVKGTLSDPNKLLRFQTALKSKSAEDSLKIKTYMQKFLSEFSSWSARNHVYKDKHGKTIPYGPGRLDGLGGPINDILCHLTDRMGSAEDQAKVTHPRNCQSSQPPVSYPHMWGITDADFVQWNGNAHFTLARNFAQSSGTFGKNWVTPGLDGKLAYQTTVNISGLIRLENLYKKLKSPDWDRLVQSGIVPALDPVKVSRGHRLYQQNCNSCHAIQPAFTKPNVFGNSYLHTPVYDVRKIGTDPAYTDAIRSRRAIVPTYWQDEFKRSKIGPDGKTSATDLRVFVILRQMMTALAGEEIKSFLLQPEKLIFALPAIGSDVAKYVSCRDIRHGQKLDGIKTRSLEGIGFTAPFLHNGSVPTLDDLLKPASLRPSKFYVGCKTFSIEKMGYDCGPTSKGAVLFNVAHEGNSNRGHEYGTHLNEAQRSDLIEFMKSISDPKLPGRYTNCY